MQHCTDVLIHIDEDLDDAAIHEIERHLAEIDGVQSACVNERARHLMLVDYDPGELRSFELLGVVRDHGVHAELIGL